MKVKIYTRKDVDEILAKEIKKKEKKLGKKIAFVTTMAAKMAKRNMSQYKIPLNGWTMEDQQSIIDILVNLGFTKLSFMQNEYVEIKWGTDMMLGVAQTQPAPPRYSYPTAPSYPDLPAQNS